MTPLLCNAPVVRVSVQQDRARVTRQGQVDVAVVGVVRVQLDEVAPVLQDLSLAVRVTSGAAHVADSRVLRTWRLGSSERPKDIAAIDEQLLDIMQKATAERDNRARAQAMQEATGEMIAQTLSDMPLDASFGLGHAALWSESLSALTAKNKAHSHKRLAATFVLEDLRRQANALLVRRAALSTPQNESRCVIEVELEVAVAGAITLEAEYTVPCALWRPHHRAHLVGGESNNPQLQLQAQALVWQNTGEDWRDVTLTFSTAKSGDAREPPLLADDPLRAHKKETAMVVQARNVRVHTAGAGIKAPPTGVVDLPGVDDGGELQQLLAPQRHTITSNGRAHVVPLFSVQTPAQQTWLAMPERSQAVHRKIEATYPHPVPLLAGEVELVADGGQLGRTTTLYLGQNEQFAWGFGHDPALRIERHTREKNDTDPSTGAQVKTFVTELFLSSVADSERTLTVVERIPVSELQKVKVALLPHETSGAPDIDEHGMVRWQLTLAAFARLRLLLTYTITSAPDVELRL